MLLAVCAVLLMVAFNVALPVCIAVFVYKDAKQRGMEPLLWAVVAALVPSFIGLIIYLLVRSSHSALHCAQCGAPVETHYAVCPQCGVALKTKCPVCGRYVQPDWRLCSDCGAELTDMGKPAVIEQAAGNQGFWIVLAILAAMLVLLVILLLVGNFAIVSLSNGGATMHHGTWMHH